MTETTFIHQSLTSRATGVERNIGSSTTVPDAGFDNLLLRGVMSQAERENPDLRFEMGLERFNSASRQWEPVVSAVFVGGPQFDKQGNLITWMGSLTASAEALVGQAVRAFGIPDRGVTVGIDIHATTVL